MACSQWLPLAQLEMSIYHPTKNLRLCPLYGVATSFRKAPWSAWTKPGVGAPSVTWETDNGEIVWRCKSTYQRPGTLNLFAALQVATGLIQTATTTWKQREEFLQLMDQIVAETPAVRQLSVILDNYCTHKKSTLGWLCTRTCVFTLPPTSASWLNQVEIWFGILLRKALRGTSFKNVTELRQAIEAFIAAYNPKAKPFKRRKRK